MAPAGFDAVAGAKLQLLVDRVERIFAGVGDEEDRGLEGDLLAKLATDRPAAACDQHHLAGDIFSSSA
jgi:hypothetical protein